MPNEEHPLNIVGQGACMHLRSKGMYVSGLLDPADDVEGMSDGYCWCNQTQHVLGPDSQIVDRANCQSGRDCYQRIV